jgi:hypothetical protein
MMSTHETRSDSNNNSPRMCNVPLVLYLVDLFPCLVVHVHDREDLYLFQGAVQSQYVEDATMVGD